MGLARTVRESLKRPEPSERRLGRKELALLWGFVRPLKWLGALSIAVTFVSAALGSALPLSAKALVDFVVLGHAPEGLGRLSESAGPLLGSLWGLAGLVLLAGVIIGLLGVAQRYLSFRFRHEFAFGIKSGLFERLLGFPVTFFRKRGSGYLISRLSDDVAALDGLFAFGLPQLVTGALQLVFGTAILALINVKLALIIAATIPVYILITRFFALRMRDAALMEMERAAEVTRHLGEAISGVETIKAHSAEPREVRKASGKMRSVIDTRLRGEVLSTMSYAATRGTQLLALVLAMWLGAAEVTRGAMSLGDLMALTAYLLFLSRAASSLSAALLAMQSQIASLWRISELFGLADEDESAAKEGDFTPLEVLGEIVFKDVTYSYEYGGRPALKGVSFSARRGEVVALVGPSGAGKTTAVNVLLKFLKPQRGSVTLDGVDTGEIPSGWLRGKIGAVSQDVFLFNDTIESNIKYGNPGATPEAVHEAVRQAGLEADIASMPLGLGTLAGERGAALSAGQRQRLSIARAILKDPPILIFDEPSSALDPRSERLIKGSIRELASVRTVIIVAHRLGAIDIADRVVVLDRGEVVESGTHEELVSAGGLYSVLFSSAAPAAPAAPAEPDNNSACDK